MRIVHGLLKPGIRLRQDEIASEFSASHVPVREAFRLLEAQGLVQSEPRRGVRVAALDRNARFEICEMRAALESLALRHAVAHFPLGYLAKLTAANQVCSDASTRIEWDAANRRFHALLVEPCAMPRLLEQINHLQAVSARFTFASGESDFAPREDRDHKAILAALGHGNTELAATLVARHARRMGHRSF